MAESELVAWKWPYFTVAEMSCHCGCGGLPRDEFMKILVAMREEANFPFVITSGFRCPEYNRQVSDSGLTGPHTTGLAADVAVAGKKAFWFLELAIRHGMTGLGVSQKGSSRFIHVDCVTSDLRPWVWSY